MKILIIDDEPANVALLQYILIAAGYTRLRSTGDPRQARALYLEFRPDLVLLDLMMPCFSGFEVMGQLAEETDPDDCLPILVLTADMAIQAKHNALLAGASDFLMKPFDHVEVLLRIRHLLHIRAQHLQLAAHKHHLEETVQERTAELLHTLSQLEEAVHQLRSTQQQVVQHERMSALGSMAAGLAHDFNNSLSLILGYGELLHGELTDSPHKKHSDDYLGTIMTAAQDAARLFGRLRGFYRQSDDGQFREPVNFNVLIEQAVELTRPRWHGQALGQGVTVDLRLELANGLPELVADAAELREMLTNLIFNAVDALPAPGGSLTLRTRLAEGAEGAEALVLEVADTGTGMSEETRRRCLEPFFTTKGQRGTGLGLAMVYGTMQRHGGSIALESAPGQGTTFILTFPVRTCAVVDKVTPEAEVGFPWRILIVDDQPDFLMALERYLKGGGLDVETACCGDEALEKFRARAFNRAFDLVITDKAMPGMCGEELAQAIKAEAPETRVILLTGYSLPDAGPTNDAAIDLTILKPVTLAALRASIGQVMTGRTRMPASGVKRRKRRLAGLPV